MVLAEACGRQHLPINCTNHQSCDEPFLGRAGEEPEVEVVLV